MKALLTNFSWGNGPYCRAVQLALQVSPPPSIVIVPLVYGDRQKKILQEEVSEQDSHRLWFDSSGGKLLSQLFYTGDVYSDFLNRLLTNIESIATQLQTHYEKPIEIHNFFGESKILPASEIEFSIGRNSLIPLLPQREVTTSFVTHSALFEATAQDPIFSKDKDLYLRAHNIFKKFQNDFSLTLLGTPRIEIPCAQKFKSVPPLIPSQQQQVPDIPKNAHTYVTVSGIENIKTPYKNIQDKQSFIMSKALDSWQGTIGPPSILSHNQIKAHWARPSWNAIWAMIVLNKPLHCLPIEKTDDPEIIWNIRTLKNLNLYAQPGDEFPMETLHILRQKILSEFQTFDGLQYAAEIIQRHFNINSRFK